MTKKTLAEFFGVFISFHTVETNLQFFIPEFRSLLCALATIIIKINLVCLIKCLYITVTQNSFNMFSFTPVIENASLEVL